MQLWFFSLEKLYLPPWKSCCLFFCTSSNNFLQIWLNGRNMDALTRSSLSPCPVLPCSLNEGSVCSHILLRAVDLQSFSVSWGESRMAEADGFTDGLKANCWKHLIDKQECLFAWTKLVFLVLPSFRKAIKQFVMRQLKLKEKHWIIGCLSNLSLGLFSETLKLKRS